MKVVLFDLENHFSPSALEEATDLVKETNEYDLSQPEVGYYHCISKHPDYHVEITLKPDGIASAKCHCTVFRRSKQCKHALAALLLLRDHIIRNLRSKSKSKQDSVLLHEVLQKLKVKDLRNFISSYAHSHGAFRAEMLANYLHLLRRPDYQNLLMDITPMDKYGTFKLNRNNLKTVRNIISTLHRQAQQLLKEKSPGESLQILDATLHHLHRLMIKVPQFQEQLSTELRHALKLFDALCHQSMAPRLQQIAINLSIDISSRDGFSFLKGSTPMLLCVEPFILEKKLRQTAFQLAEKKMLTDHAHALTWACMVIRWMRLWNFLPKKNELKPPVKKLLPDIIQEFSRQGEHEDVIFSIRMFHQAEYDKGIRKATLQAGLRSSRQTGEPALLIKLASDLSLNFLDQEAWDWLYEVDPENAKRILKVLTEYYPPGSDVNADHLLLHGWDTTEEYNNLLERLDALGDIDLVKKYDGPLKETLEEELENLYVKYIHATREAYGGVIARQKLSNIFGHLKSIDIYVSVVEKLKNMDKRNNGTMDKQTGTIKGFIFDLDGVIVDTAVHHFQSWKKVLKQLGADIADEDDHHTRGASRMESLEYLLDRYGIHLSQEEKEYWAAKKNDIYLEAIQQITPKDLLPGALDFLIDSKKAGLLLALGSASKNARGVLNKLKIEDRFDAILDGNDATESKPHPEIFIKASQALHLDPAVVVVFEDAAKGVAAAKAAGCKVVGLGDPESLKAADLVISGLDKTVPSKIIEQLK